MIQSSPSFPECREDLLLAYPKAFGDEIAGVTREYDLPDSLLTALIREESYFNPDAVSHAGARGLSQLMPATAAEVAERLNIADIDLSHPETNVALGGWYLNNLIERTESIPEALCSYNAGITRIRRWRGKYESLPLDLFLETIPFDETREYSRKVISSFLMYTRLYDGIPINKSAGVLFAH